MPRTPTPIASTLPPDTEEPFDLSRYLVEEPPVNSPAHPGYEMCWPGIFRLQEELAKFSTLLCQLMAHPMGQHPDVNGPIIDRLQSKMADVRAVMDWFSDTNRLDIDPARIFEKINVYDEWHTRWGGMRGILVPHAAKG